MGELMRSVLKLSLRIVVCGIRLENIGAGFGTGYCKED